MPASGWYDLTLPIQPGMPVYPGDPGVKVQVHADYDTDGFRTSEWHLGSHTGTHVDAPKHFLPDGLGIDRLAHASLIGVAHLVDARHRGHNTQIMAADLRLALPCKRLLLCTGWDRYWGTPAYYSEMPGLSQDAVQAIIAAGVQLVALDTPNVHATDWAQIHSTLLGAGVVLVEGLQRVTDLLPAQSVNLVVAPLPLVASDGAPARVLAQVGQPLWPEQSFQQAQLS